MNVIFTICSNNYLAQAKVLGLSLKRHAPTVRFIIFLCDEKSEKIDYNLLADEIIAVADIEPNLMELVLKYNVIELNTCLKPRAFEYLLEERNIEKVIYLDPDIKLFQPIDFLFEELNKSSILLTPHIYTPIPIDGKQPSENKFLNFGIYNLGFLGLRNDEEAKKLVYWWKGHTYKQGYFDEAKGIFVDQLPMNHVHIFFNNVLILQDMGLNMAPWNLHERYLSFADGKYLINDKIPLKFYHFSSFNINELPLHYYDRFTLAERPDLLPIYKAYNEEMIAANHPFYQQFKSAYTSIKEAEEWEKQSAFKKMFGKKKAK